MHNLCLFTLTSARGCFEERHRNIVELIIKDEIVIGVFNVRRELDKDWGRIKLKKLIDSFRMVQMVEEPMRVVKDCASKIDLLYQWGRVGKIKECKVIHRRKISDHRCVRFK